ncbi:MAG: peptidoglycan-binding protein [Magnetospirillum sp. WYHS-4]
MSFPLRLKSTLGRPYNVSLDDVVPVKRVLQGLGYYAIPSYGITPYPDEPLFQGIERFQRDNNLRVDGIMKPGGPTESTLNHVFTRRFARDGGSRVNSQRLFSLFDRFSAADPEDDPRDGKCRATGTCENIY